MADKGGEYSVLSEYNKVNYRTLLSQRGLQHVEPDRKIEGEENGIMQHFYLLKESEKEHLI